MMQGEDCHLCNTGDGAGASLVGVVGRFSGVKVVPVVRPVPVSTMCTMAYLVPYIPARTAMYLRGTAYSVQHHQ